MSVTNFPQRRRRSVVGSCPLFTRLIATRDVEDTDEAGPVSILPAGEIISVEAADDFAVTGLTSPSCKRVRLLGKDYDAVNIDLPFEERRDD